MPWEMVILKKTSKKTKKRRVDFTLFLVTNLLIFIGIIMVFSSSWPEAMIEFGNGFYFLRKQIIAAILGFIAMIVFMNFNYKYFQKLAPFIYIIAIILGLLIFSSMGRTALGARRWLEIMGFRFMPSDLIKLGSIIFFANFLTIKRDKLTSFVHGTIPALMYIGISCGLIYLQKDLGTTVTLAGTMMGMFFIAGMKLTHLFALGAGAGSLLYFAITDSDNIYRMDRWLAFKDPFAYKLDEGWQAVQSLYALGSGGILGLGLGKSRQKFFYIPESYNDFIFSIIGEELGLLGALTVLLLLMLLIWRGIIIAIEIEDTFGRYLATGITALIAIQSIIHIAVVTSSIPTTGITLPFISFGGTSLIVYMAAMGILLNISRHTNRE